MKTEFGFTLVELLITLLVASILLAVAVPSFNDFIWNNRVVASNNQLVNALAVTRSEAIRRRQNTVLCPSADQLNCTGNPNWEAGWIIYNDADADGVNDNNAAESTLRVWDAQPNGMTITAAGGATRVTFDRLGATNNADTFSVNNPDCETGQADRERDVALIGTGTTSYQRMDCP